MFPFYGDKKSEEIAELPICKDIDWDYENNKPKYINGMPKWVYGLEAVKAWCYRTLQVRRYNLEMYTWNFGVEFENLVGKHYSKQYTRAEAIRYIQEALSINPDITGISNVIVSSEGSNLNISCNIDTVYGTEEVAVSV